MSNREIFLIAHKFMGIIFYDDIENKECLLTNSISVSTYYAYTGIHAKVCVFITKNLAAYTLGFYHVPKQLRSHL